MLYDVFVVQEDVLEDKALLFFSLSLSSFSLFSLSLSSLSLSLSLSSFF